MCTYSHFTAVSSRCHKHECVKAFNAASFCSVVYILYTVSKKKSLISFSTKRACRTYAIASIATLLDLYACRAATALYNWTTFWDTIILLWSNILRSASTSRFIYYAAPASEYITTVQLAIDHFKSDCYSYFSNFSKQLSQITSCSRLQ